MSLADVRALVIRAGLALAADVAGITALAGGSISEVALIRLVSGTALVVKTAPQAPPGMYAAEAAGLAAIGGRLRTPAVLGTGPAVRQLARAGQAVPDPVTRPSPTRRAALPSRFAFPLFSVTMYW